MNIYLYSYLGLLFFMFVPVFIQMYYVKKILKTLIKKTEKLVED
jgi:peptidoglycan biosynthesis protein MviN/MurJ (putative lipid II flippase)